MGLLDSLAMLGKSVFSSKEEKAAWTIQFFQIAAEHPGWSRDDIIALMQTEEATRIRKEFVRNHSPAEIEAFVNKLLATIESANEGLKDEAGDLTQSEYDHGMKEIEIDRKHWAKEEASAIADYFNRRDAILKKWEQEEAESGEKQEETQEEKFDILEYLEKQKKQRESIKVKWTWKSTIIFAIIFAIVLTILHQGFKARLYVGGRTDYPPTITQDTHSDRLRRPNGDNMPLSKSRQELRALLGLEPKKEEEEPRKNLPSPIQPVPLKYDEIQALIESGVELPAPPPTATESLFRGVTLGQTGRPAEDTVGQGFELSGEFLIFFILAVIMIRIVSGNTIKRTN